MAASSDRKIEANRRNAAKSTGPKSNEGKEKSRRNGWKHGMAAVVVVPEEETAAFEAARAEWNRQIKPDDIAEESLVEQMATADVRMKRCARVAEAAMEGDAIEAVRRWEAKRRHRVRRQVQDLKDDPVNVVADLEASSFGCDWLIRRWRSLDGSLRLGIALGRQNLEEALRLLGYAQPMAPTSAGEPAAIRFWTLAIRASGGLVKAGDHFRPDPAVTEDWKEAQAELRKLLAAQIERLEGLREEAWEAIDGPEAEAVAAKALMDAGKEVQVRHRYYRDAQMAQQRAAKLLMTMRDRKRAGIVDASKGVTGAAVLEALCVEVVAREKAEAAAAAEAASSPSAAPATPRSEANATADRGAADRHNPNEKRPLENAPATRSDAATKRTEPRFPHVDDPTNGVPMGSPSASTTRNPANGAA